jgi:FAD/FMN-containing dehydrogenase
VKANLTVPVDNSVEHISMARRRLVLASAGATVGLFVNPATARICTVGDAVGNVSALGAIDVERVIAIQNVDELREALRGSSGSVAIGGGRYSMGGQTGIACGLHLDMRQLTSVLSFDPAKQRIRVHAGARWRDLQALIDPHGLSIRTMQSFANFTVGGSISVNCHGRYVGHGAIAESIEAITLCLSNGELIEATLDKHRDLFAAVVGGYGAVGVIVDATLRLDHNEIISKRVQSHPLADYFDWAASEVVKSNSAVMHNADLIPGAWRTARSTTWQRAATSEVLTNTARLRDAKSSTLARRTAVSVLSTAASQEKLRPRLQTFRDAPPQTVWRNYEASLDLASLEPVTRTRHTFVLEEFFIPERHARDYALALVKRLEIDSMGTLNVSIRHAPADEIALMSWAREPAFSFVLYARISTRQSDLERFAEWVRTLIELALSVHGSYYLPYRLHATKAQFVRAYPHAERLKKIRNETSAGKFLNSLWEKYLL